MDKVIKSEQEWRDQLSAEQYHVLREKGTERAFTGKYWDVHDDGIYRCAACGAALFDAGTKFDSGTGWPSFTEPVNRANVELITDSSHGMTRTEVTCAACGSHLGHVFDGRTITAGASAGVAILDIHSEAGRALEAADSAMYVRKALRRHELS